MVEIEVQSEQKRLIMSQLVREITRAVTLKILWSHMALVT